MYHTKNEFKSKVLSIFLVFTLILLFFVFVGVFISGPYFEDIALKDKIIHKINKDFDEKVMIERQAFAYVTYTVETKDEYYIYNENGEYVLVRNKDTLQLEKVKAIVKQNYPSLQDEKISITYGYDSIVYYIEKDLEILVLDYDSLEELFYMKEKK